MTIRICLICSWNITEIKITDQKFITIFSFLPQCLNCFIFIYTNLMN